MDDASFCDRDAELAMLTGRMRSGIHAFLLSPRRYGKTSLALTALDRFRADGGRGGYANLLLCTTEDEVASVMLTAVVREVLRPAGRARRSLEDVIRRVRISPRVGVSSDGSVNLSFDATASTTSWLDVLIDAIDLLESAADDGGAALVLDEFQAVADIGARGLGGVFKALADHTRQSSLVFSGSHLSVMEALTRRPGAPLLGMGETLRLDVIPEGPMAAHLTRRARAARKRLPAETARHLYRAAGAVPNDVQWLAHVAFEVAGSSTDITDDHVAEALRTIVSHQAVAFAERFEVLSPAQQRVVRALAHRPTRQVYARAFLDSIRVANANAVRTALDVLSDAELVRQGRDGTDDVARWRLTSPFFAAWLRGQTPR